MFLVPACLKHVHEYVTVCVEYCAIVTDLNRNYEAFKSGNFYSTDSHGNSALCPADPPLLFGISSQFDSESACYCDVICPLCLTATFSGYRTDHRRRVLLFFLQLSELHPTDTISVPGFSYNHF